MNEIVMTSRELAQAYRVDSKTTARWHTAGLLPTAGIEVIRTLGGHRRYRLPGPIPELMTPQEVARLLRVERATVTRYVGMGRLDAAGIGVVRTPGGHVRLVAADVRRYLAQDGGTR